MRKRARIGENAGYKIEWGGSWGNSKVIFPLMKEDVSAGFMFFTTDAHGPMTGMEIFNTGVLRAQRAFESRKEAIISQKTGLYGPATGLGVYAGSSIFTVNIFAWAPLWYEDATVDTGTDLSTYYRATFNPTLGDWDTMIGIFGYAGETKCVECAGGTDLVTYRTKAFGVDAQLQGELKNGMTLEAHAQLVSTGDDPSEGANTTDILQKAEGWSVDAQLGISRQLGLMMAYTSYTDKSGSEDMDTNGFARGLWYNWYQNVQVRLEYTSYSGDGRSKDNKLYLMLFAGF